MDSAISNSFKPSILYFFITLKISDRLLFYFDKLFVSANLPAPIHNRKNVSEKRS